MPRVTVEFDEETLSAMDRIAQSANRKRADFIRQAVLDALYQIECDQMKRRYLDNPDSEAVGAADWVLPEEWNA